MIAFKSYTRFPFIPIRNVCRPDVNIQRKMSNHKVWKQFTNYKSSMYEKQEICSSFFLTYRYMAGHAKWQNIKHVKEEKDRQKSLLCNKFVRLITAAVREKGPDPKANNRLATILENARRENVPNATLENAFKKASSKKIQYGTIEMLGPGGYIAVMEYETDNLCEMRRSLKIMCRKHSVGIYPTGGGKWRAAYEQKGIIKVTNQLNGEPFDSEKMLDAAIEAGAEDVQKGQEEDCNLYEFYCAPGDLNIVKKELEQKFMIDEAYVAFLPICTAPLSDADKTSAMNFLNELGDLPDVLRLYENIE